MRLITKILTVETDNDGEITHEYWDDYSFEASRYVSHASHEFGSFLYLEGMPGSVVVKFSFNELSKELDFLNTFEIISLN